MKVTMHLFVLRELVRRDFLARYAGSALGLLWSFLQPLWMLVLFSFVFSAVLRAPLLGERTGSFAVFLFCGLFPWLAVHEGLQRSATAVTDNSHLIKKLRFPPEILVLTVVTTAVAQQLITATLFVAILAWRGELAWGSLPLLLVALPLQLLLTVGLGLLLAAVNVFVRDTSQVLGLVLQTWFYVTPIVYPLEMVPEPYRAWLALNPLVALVELYRQALLGPDVALVPGVGRLAVFALVAAAAGVLLFRRLKPAFVDEV